MPGYDFENGVKAWTKSAFGLFVGFTFFYVFNSGFLAILAAAFFFFIPLTNRNAENILNKSIFGGLMMILLFWAFGFGDSVVGLGLDLGVSGVAYLGIGLFFAGAGLIGASMWKKISALALLGIILLGVSIWMMEPWKWNNTAIIFTGVWLVGLTTGLAGDIESRTTTGVIILVISFLLYTIGPGSQDVGVAFFGQWWPTVYNSANTVLQPLGNAWSQMSGTIGNAWMLLTNPVGYATQLMNGSYASNPVGQTGAFGVELTSFEVTPINIEQPFMITTNIKNNGAYNADKLSITLTSGSDSPLPSLSTSSQRATIKDLGIEKCGDSNQVTGFECTYTFDNGNNFTRQNIWQTYYTGKISCAAAGKFQIRKKYLPVNITLKYDYTTESTLGKGTDKLEFISNAEWDRLSRIDKLELKNVESEYTSGPVKFPIGTPGLKSPIREDQDFHIGLSLMSAQKGGKIVSVQSVELTYPKDFIVDTCNPSSSPVCTTDMCTVTWKDMKSNGDKFFYCHVTKLEGKLGNSPTKSYVVTAKAKYTYSVSQDKIMKVDFGSWCCTQEPIKDSCASGMQCCPEDKTSGKGICAPTSVNCEGGTTTGATTTTTSTSGCCQNVDEFAFYCSNVDSASKCTAPGTLVSNAACNQTTGKCEAKTS